MPPDGIPGFGWYATPWPQVKAFYDWWGDFSTAKDFSWADQYHTPSAVNRFQRRGMERENAKARKTKGGLEREGRMCFETENPRAGKAIEREQRPGHTTHCDCSCVAPCLIISSHRSSSSPQRREFNDVVRQLVQFVKRRDKRVMERKVAVEEARRQAAAEEEARRQREREEAKRRAAEWQRQQEEARR